MGALGSATGLLLPNLLASRGLLWLQGQGVDSLVVVSVSLFMTRHSPVICSQR